MKLKEFKYIFQKNLRETNISGGGASFTPGNSINYSTPKFLSRKKMKNKEELKEIIKKIIIKESSYSKFKKQTQNRTKAEQLHTAIKEINKKLNEVERLVEYTSRMKTELNESGDLKYWKATSNKVSKISETISRINTKAKDLLQ